MCVIRACHPRIRFHNICHPDTAHIWIFNIPEPSFSIERGSVLVFEEETYFNFNDVLRNEPLQLSPSQIAIVLKQALWGTFLLRCYTFRNILTSRKYLIPNGLVRDALTKKTGICRENHPKTNYKMTGKKWTAGGQKGGCPTFWKNTK